MSNLIAMVCQECGFDSGCMPQGGGLLNFMRCHRFPALCSNCRALVLDNYLLPAAECPACHKPDVLRFYNQPGMFVEPAAAPRPLAGGGDDDPGAYAADLTAWPSANYYITPGPPPEGDDLMKDSRAWPLAVYEAAAARTPAELDVPTALCSYIQHTDKHLRLPKAYLLCPVCMDYTIRVLVLGSWD